MLISTRRGKSSTHPAPTSLSSARGLPGSLPIRKLRRGRDPRKPYGGLEQKRMKHACCELEKRKLDK